jgi:hypothetical protein
MEQISDFERPLFAALGRAVYNATLLEVRVAFHMARPAGLLLIPQSALKARAEKYRSWTLGRLVGELRKKRPDTDPNLLAAIDARAEDRKRLVHHMLWDRIEEAVTVQGRDALIEEMDAMAARFTETNRMMKRADNDWLRKRGGTPLPPLS